MAFPEGIIDDVDSETLIVSNMFAFPEGSKTIVVSATPTESNTLAFPLGTMDAVFSETFIESKTLTSLLVTAVIISINMFSLTLIESKTLKAKKIETFMNSVVVTLSNILIFNTEETVVDSETKTSLETLATKLASIIVIASATVTLSKTFMFNT